MKLKKGDEVKVVRGKDKGRTGKIDRVLSKEDKVSEIITIIKPLPVSNVLLVCPKCHLTTRVGFSIDKDQKIRICKKCKQTI